MFKVISIFLIMTLVGYLYDKYRVKLERKERLTHHDIVRKYLLNDNALSSKKPIVWVHIDYETNSRNWESFGSRNNDKLNQPYKFITLQSIINKAGSNFNVCFIDDDSFSKLMPNWSISLHSLAEPIKSYMRNLALCKLLYMYGGMLVPSSYVALKSLNGIYDTGLEYNDCFIVESRNTSIMANKNDIGPSHLFMGCEKESETMREIIQYLEIVNSKDYTNEQKFLGDVDRKCNLLIKQNKMRLLDGKLIGTKDNFNNAIYSEQLLGQSNIDFNAYLQGIYIPDREILNYSKYQWFARLSPQQIYESDMVISHYLLLSNELQF